ncbi:response regulator transcription factor [Clostridium kluyveri]|uniref:Stage 0 sporulation protein A homolog n=1 Tax=Clostridium kluyveri TaxID=1534 RepID=A0A1L5F3Q6_CLOKL|nr:response regulator transcription factor [Clostridium kluyveri]APM37651.1 DNA-binding response regulator [Clostridium kluyveri]
MYKIMIIEDDRALSDNIMEMLIKWDFNVYGVRDYSNILSEFIENKPHLVVMDINLPYFDGFYWCNKIREISQCPIIFLSSRDSNMDIIMAVNMGADDYITKPFSMDVLIAKISALIRRTYSYGEGASELLECNRAILNLTYKTLSYNERKIELTKNEFKIMLLLMKNNGKTISRERIMRTLWDDDNFISDNTLTVNINRLRMRLRDIGLYDFIKTKKGRGYEIS